MAFRQMHYTSCEHGLSGHSGFQFCAMTPGIEPEVMREVERLTVYETPRDWQAGDSGTSPNAYPVNLLYTVSHRTGATLIARTVYAGTDFSKRSGNYFAHALVTDSPIDTTSPMLPIELWEAPFWESRQGGSTALPVLPDPLPSGPVTRETASQILGSGHEKALGLLLAAVDEAMAGGQQVVFVDVDATTIFYWIAAICYLLGPDLGPQLTFATYSHDPQACPAHIVGMIHSGGPLRPGSVTNTRTFDLARDITPDLSPHPAATLLARTGVASSGRLWELVRALAPSAPVDLSAIFPALASAALLLEHQLTGPEISAAIEWLAAPGNDHVSKHCAAAVQATLQHSLEVLSVERQADLLDLAFQADMTTAGARHDLPSQVERTLINAMLARVDRGERPGDIVTLRTRRGREHASAACNRRLLTLDPQRAIDLLMWAVAAGATPAEDTIRRLGEGTVLLAVLDGDPPIGLQRAAQRWPALLRGMLDKLGGLPAALQKAALTGLVGDLCQPEDFSGHPELYQSWLVFSATQGRIDKVDACHKLVQSRRQQGQRPALDQPLVESLWPDRDWTAREALAILAKLPSDELASNPARQQFSMIFNTMPPAGEADEWMSFVILIALAPKGVLPEHETVAALHLVPVIRLIQKAAEGPAVLESIVPEIIELYYDADSGARYFLGQHLSPLILNYPRPSFILRHFSPAFHKEFCIYLRELLEGRPHNPALAAQVFAIRTDLNHMGEETYTNYIDDYALAPTVLHWPRREHVKVAREAEQLRKGQGGRFRLWLAHYRAPWLFGRRRQEPG